MSKVQNKTSIIDVLDILMTFLSSVNIAPLRFQISSVRKHFENDFLIQLQSFVKNIWKFHVAIYQNWTWIDVRIFLCVKKCCFIWNIWKIGSFWIRLTNHYVVWILNLNYFSISLDKHCIWSITSSDYYPLITVKNNQSVISWEWRVSEAWSDVRGG